MKNPLTNCYLCGKPEDSHFTRDHIPPKGLFLGPRPNNLITVPCCFECNQKHSGFDERLRIIASMSFDRNDVGQRIVDEKVVGSTFAQNRQIKFAEQLAGSLLAVADQPALFRVGRGIDNREFSDGMIQITKGLLFALHPNLNYHELIFTPISIRQQPSKNQLRLMTGLILGEYLELGQGVFQCWRKVAESRKRGVWMLVFYECYGYFVFHQSASDCNTWNCCDTSVAGKIF